MESHTQDIAHIHVSTYIPITEKEAWRDSYSVSHYKSQVVKVHKTSSRRTFAQTTSISSEQLKHVHALRKREEMKGEANAARG